MISFLCGLGNLCSLAYKRGKNLIHCFPNDQDIVENLGMGQFAFAVYRGKFTPQVIYKEL